MFQEVRSQQYRHNQARHPEKDTTRLPIARPIGELDVVVPGPIEKNALEGAIDSQNIFSAAIHSRSEILSLAFCQANNPSRICVYIESG